MSTSMREALEPINMQDVRLVCGEGKLEAKHVLEAVNIILKQRAERAAPASSEQKRLARTLYRRLVLNPPADFDDASADLQNEWLQLADAIMRETR